MQPCQLLALAPIRVVDTLVTQLRQESLYHAEGCEADEGLVSYLVRRRSAVTFTSHGQACSVASMGDGPRERGHHVLKGKSNGARTLPVSKHC